MKYPCTVFVEDSQEVAQTYDITVVPTQAEVNWAEAGNKSSLNTDDVLARLQLDFGLSAADSVRFLAKPNSTRVLSDWLVSDVVLASYGPF